MPKPSPDPTTSAVEFGVGFVRSFSRVAEQADVLQELIVGFYVVSLLDSVRRTRTLDRREALRVLKDIHRLTDLPLRRRLTNLVKSADPKRVGWQIYAMSQLSGYGQELHKAGHYDAAIETFRVIANAPFADRLLRLYAMQRMAMAARSGGQFDFADAIYRELLRQSTASKNVEMEFKARLGLARVLIERRHLDDASIVLSGLLEEATRRKDLVLAAHVHNDLAAVAGLMSNYAGALPHAFEAARHLPTRAAKDRVLTNVAEALVNLGYYDLASHIVDWLAVNASEIAMRQDALSVRARLEAAARACVTQADPTRLAAIQAALDELVPMTA